MVALGSIVPGEICFEGRQLIRLQVILVHAALVDQSSKVSNLLMSEHPSQLGSLTRFKFRALGSSVHFQLRVGAKPGQFLESSRIFPNRHVSLFQLQELHFHLPFQISRDVFVKEFLLESTLGNQLSLRLHLASSELPPVLGLRH
ncbi:hypothetical protein Lalb_Chr09g0333111 [Lupinus albus]|uniref:Uncharacterized protein n=1 Tax=Lupinus albus TaxID=3870 RepID=A0A6A4Q195_LUPAL|nr:hypothetical protein Lalb_Chr09g0333111 [Lupinus albus]